MSFSLNTRTVRNVVILDLEGRITVGESVLLLRETIHRLCEQGFTEFVVNLESVSYIDSCGLGELVANYTSVTRRQGTVCILKPTSRTLHLLETTRLSTVFPIFGDEAAAVESRSGKAASQN